MNWLRWISFLIGDLLYLVLLKNSNFNMCMTISLFPFIMIIFFHQSQVRSLSLSFTDQLTPVSYNLCLWMTFSFPQLGKAVDSWWIDSCQISGQPASVRSQADRNTKLDVLMGCKDSHYWGLRGLTTTIYTLVNLKVVDLSKKTQPFGPLCPWQCFRQSLPTGLV